MKKYGLLVIGLCLTVSYLWAQEGAMSPDAPVVLNLKATLKVGTGIEAKEIDGENTTFSVNVGKIYCWSLIEGAQEPMEIRHQWWHEGKLVIEVPLTIKYARFRTWSYKTIVPEMVGNWEVKVVDNQDKVLNLISFQVTKETESKPVETSPEPKTEPETE